MLSIFRLGFEKAYRNVSMATTASSSDGYVTKQSYKPADRGQFTHID